MSLWCADGSYPALRKCPSCAWCLPFSPSIPSLTGSCFSIQPERLLPISKGLICILSPHKVLRVTWCSLSRGALYHRCAVLALTDWVLCLSTWRYVCHVHVLYIMKITIAVTFKWLQWLWIHPPAVKPSPLFIFRMYSLFALTHCARLTITPPQPRFPGLDG